jgi:poly(3-hydroxybutyrate) depolymerase
MGTEVELYRIEAHEHTWPGGKNGARYANINPPTEEISATYLMWDLFARNPKK